MELDAAIKRLVDKKYKNYPVTSLYLGLGPQDRQNMKYKKKQRIL